MKATVFAAAAYLLFCQPFEVHSAPSFYDAEKLPSQFTGSGLNDNGVVCGHVNYQLAICSGGTLTILGAVEEGKSTFGIDINDAGAIAGSYTENDRPHGFVYVDGVFAPLGLPDGASEPHSVSVKAINNSGQIVGSTPDPGNGQTTAFLFQQGGFILIPPMEGGYVSNDAYDINDRGDVIVFDSAGTTPDAIRLFTSSGGYELIDFVNVFRFSGGPHAINNHQRIAANINVGIGRIYEMDGEYLEIGGIGGRYSYGRDLNDFGEAVGEAETEEGDIAAFLYDGDRMYDLNQLTNNRDGYVLFSATRINNRGQILAVGRRGSGLAYFLLQPGIYVDSRPETSAQGLGDRVANLDVSTQSGATLHVTASELPVPVSIQRSEDMVEWHDMGTLLADTPATDFTDRLAALRSSSVYRVLIATVPQRGFLAFPLIGSTPYNHRVSAVMDRDAAVGVTRVVAYNGETGEVNPVVIDGVTGYAKVNGEPFSLPLLNYDDQEPSSVENTHLFYKNHRGYDYPVSRGSRVLASASGRLFVATTNTRPDGVSVWRNPNEYPVFENVTYSWGQYRTFYIVHPFGYASWYLHCEALADGLAAEIVSNGFVFVERGQHVASSGDMGSPGAEHLHFGVRRMTGLNEYGTVTSELVDPYGNSDSDYSMILWQDRP